MKSHYTGCQLDDKCTCQDYDNEKEESITDGDCDDLLGSSKYRYLGDFSACEMWAARSMSCDACRVSWTGCWDNFLCPECDMGELPGFDADPMTMDEIKEMHESMISLPNA